ncbi:hypothetical protein [Streptomyces tendae]
MAFDMLTFPTPHLGLDIAAGWQYLLGHPGLRPLFFNALLFGGSVMMASPLMAVLMLDHLGLAPGQYGLALGLPCLGGVLGSRTAATPDAFMSRVSTSWSVGTKTCQAAFVSAGGLISAAAGVRGGPIITVLLGTASTLLGGSARGGSRPESGCPPAGSGPVRVLCFPVVTDESMFTPQSLR